MARFLCGIASCDWRKSKWLKFEKEEVWNKSGEFLGDISKQGRQFVFIPQSNSPFRHIVLYASCLDDISSYLKEKNGNFTVKIKAEII